MSDTANIKRRNPGKTSEFSVDNEISKDYDNEKSHRSNIHVHRVLPCIPANILLVTFLAGLLFLAYCFHYTLPMPVNENYGPNGEAVFSEKNAREIVRVLSEDIGYRIVGTREEKHSVDYLLELIEEYRQQSRANPNALEFDVDVQIGTGSHRFDMMSKVVMKHYVNVTNIVVRLSCGPECNKNAILLNSHFDSSLASPGAADDGVGVAVMLEVIRVMSQSRTKRKNAAIFLFNGAEESLQDASHHFITTHPYKDTVRAVVNLEACGQYGREILFQANSLEMIQAYKTVPYPHGTVTANDIFRTGLILSDTDFRQFVDYGHLTGLDMALYKNSYFYHTPLDKLDSVTPGTIQHMGDNSLALFEFLTSEADLTGLKFTSNVIYYDLLGQYFIVYEWETAQLIHGVTVFIVSILIIMESRKIKDALSLGLGALTVAMGLILGVAMPNIIAKVYTVILGKKMLYFSNELFPLVMYGPFALIGIYLSQLLFRNLIPTMVSSLGERRLERFAYFSALVFWATGLAITTYFEIASSYLFWLYTVTFLAGLFFNDVLIRDRNNIHLGAYMVAQIIPTLLFGDGTFSLLDLFVPLTGRTGVDAAVDNIVGTLTGIIVFLLFPSLNAFSHRFGRKGLRKSLVTFGIIGTAVLIVFGVYPGVFPYDEMHPKRIYVQYVANLTSNTADLQIAHADQGPLEPVIRTFEESFSTQSIFRTHTEETRDWDVIYPFSQFLESYTIPVPFNRSLSIEENQHLPLLSTSRVSYDSVTKTRHLTLMSYHPTLVWTVVSFSANVSSWSIGEAEPFPYKHRYIVKIVSGWESNAWRLDVSYAAESDMDRLKIDFTGLVRETLGHNGWTKNKWLNMAKENTPEWVTGAYVASVNKVYYL